MQLSETNMQLSETQLTVFDEEAPEYQLLSDAGPAVKPLACWSRPLVRWSAALLALVMVLITALAGFWILNAPASDSDSVAIDYDMSLFEFLERHEQPLRRARRSSLYPNMELLGSGYHLFRGDPLSPSISADPGIVTNHPVFAIENEDTPGTRIIPQGRCVETFNSREVYGMSSFRNELENTVGVSASYDGLFFSGSFSMSTTWGSVEAATQSRRSVLVQSEARCSIYTAGIVPPTRWDSPSSRAPLSASFKSALDWLANQRTLRRDYFEELIDFYGTHAIFDNMVMGSLTGFRSELTEESYLNFQSSSFSIETASSVSALTASFGAETGNSREREQAEQFEQARTRVERYSIGSVASEDWPGVTHANPAPILFNLLDLSLVIEHFSEHPHLAAGMRDALTHYCYLLQRRGEHVRCTEPAPDVVPVPSPPARFRTCRRSTQSFGGNGGGDFGQRMRPADWIWASNAAVTSITLRAGARVDSLQFNMRHNDGQVFQSPTVGGGGGGPRTINVPTNVRIVGINLRSGANLDNIQFVFSNGQSSPVHGGGGGGAHSVRFSGQNARLVGFHGRSGNRIDRLGFTWAYEVPEGQSC
jgi:hypothetical protein